MRVFLLGDRFITNDMFRCALEKQFEGHNLDFTYTIHQLQWPVVPMASNDEVAEFSGTDEELLPLVGDVEVILSHTGFLTRRVIEHAPGLKAIAMGRGGPGNVNAEACAERGIPVIYAPGRNSGAVAEFAVGLILAQSRSIPQSHPCLRHRNQWRGDLYASDFAGNKLSCSTLGLVGFGAIGSKVARILHGGFGSRVLVYDPYIPEDVKRQYPDYAFTDLDTVLSQSDYLSLHTKVTGETTGMIGEEAIGKMKPGAVFINTARPQLVDYDALYEVLRSGKLRGAGLDVFEDEPPKAGSKLVPAGKRHRHAASRRRVHPGGGTWRGHRGGTALHLVNRQANAQISVRTGKVTALQPARRGPFMSH